jgi:hypothetical protein
MDLPENQPENQTSNNPAPENSTPPAENPQNLAPVNAVAEEIKPAELIAPRGRGRPRGSKTKNRRADGKFAPGTPENAAPANVVAPEFVSSIPGEPAPAGAAPVADPSQASPDAQNAPQAVDYRATAVFVVTMATGTLAGVIGPEWKPDDKNEEEILINAVEAYMRTKQTPEIPPGMMLALVVAGYSMKRINQPGTRSFLERAKIRAGKIALWFKSKMARKRPAPVTPTIFNSAPATP